MSDVPIGEHAFLSDCGTSALVTAAGSVDWLCLPRFDSPPVFGRLLDEGAGHFSIAPADDTFASSWRYVSPGLVLETTWSAPGGELVVTDAMALGAHERGHELSSRGPRWTRATSTPKRARAGRFHAHGTATNEHRTSR